jgi:hypothetical protein
VLFDLVHWMVGQVLVELSNHPLLDVGMERLTQIAQGARWGRDDEYLDPLLPDEPFEHARHLASKSMRFDVMPVGWFDRAPSAADAPKRSTRLVRALLSRGRICIDEYLVYPEIGKLFLAVIAQKKYLAAVGHYYERVMRHSNFIHLYACAPAE